MSTKLTLNRREGVVAAQDIHLNRSVYSQPMTISITEDTIKQGTIKFSEVVSVAPLITVKEKLVSSNTDTTDAATMQATIVYAFNEVTPVKELLVSLNTDSDVAATFEHNIVYALKVLPRVSENLVSSNLDTDNLPVIEHYYNTIILDNFKESLEYQPIKFKETTDAP